MTSTDTERAALQEQEAALRRVTDAPAAIRRIRGRLAALEAHERRLRREAVAERVDPTWRGRLESAAAELAAAERALAVAKAAALRRDRAAAEVDDDDMGRFFANVPEVRGAAGGLLDMREPPLAAADLVRSRAAARYARLRSWPARLAAERERGGGPAA